MPARRSAKSRKCLFQRVFTGSPNSVYPAVSRNDNHCSRGQRPRALDASQLSAPLRYWHYAPDSRASCKRRPRDRSQSARAQRTTGPRGVIDGRDDEYGDCRGEHAGREQHRLGTRASANTSGPDFTIVSRPVEPWSFAKLRTARASHRTKKTCFFCRTGFRREQAPFKMTIQPFDLMSRRHPLSST